MASVAVTFGAICPANNHLRLSASLDGSPARQFALLADDLLEAWTPESAEAAVISLLKLHFKGRTRAQIRAEIINGLSLTV